MESTRTMGVNSHTPTAECISAVAQAGAAERSHRRSRHRRGGRSSASRASRAVAAPAASVDDIINAARQASLEAQRGVNSCDLRFRWHVLGTNAQDAGEQLVADDGDAPIDTDTQQDANDVRPASTIPVGFFEHLLSDGAIIHDTVFALQLRLAQAGIQQARVVIGGSTGMRMEATGASHASTAKVAATFPFSDVDIDVYVPEAHSRAAVVDAIDYACADIVRDPTLESKCEQRMPPGITLQGRRANSRVFTTNERDEVVAVDVPKLSDKTLRMRHAALFATRNDTLEGMVLHRIRLAVRSTGPESGCPKSGSLPGSVALMDIKTRMGEAPPCVDRRYAGLRVRVPSAEASVRELQRLLSREYTGVDAAKDTLRQKQLAFFRERGIQGVP